MYNTYHYTYDPVDGLQRVAAQVAKIIDIRRFMEIAHNKGLPPTDSMVQDIITLYVNHDPKQDLIHAWYEGNDFVRVPMEQDYPWLRYYLGDDAAPLPPEDDIAGRQVIADQEVDAFLRRLFKSQRTKDVNNLKVTVNGNTYDADETSQTRMARAISIAHAQLFGFLIAELDALSIESTLTPQQLAGRLRDALNSGKAALSTMWMMADNSQAEVTPDELTEACHTGMLQMKELWGFTPQE